MADELRESESPSSSLNEGVEEVELTEPWEAVKEAGADTGLIAPEGGEVQAFNHLDKGERFSVDETLGEARRGRIRRPGPARGASPTPTSCGPSGRGRVRQRIFSAGKPVGVICHGPWTLVEADRRARPQADLVAVLQTDIRNAGGEWVDEEVVVDQGLVSSRKPDDLPAFNAKIVEEFAEGVHEGRRRSGRERRLRPGLRLNPSRLVGDEAGSRT